MKQKILYAILGVVMVALGGSIAMQIELTQEMGSLQKDAAEFKKSAAMLSQAQNSGVDFLTIQKEIDAIKNDVGTHKFEQSFREYMKTRTTLNPREKGYGKLETNLGALLVNVEKVEPYLDGYKYYLEIGNINQVVFNGFNVYATWYDLKTQMNTTDGGNTDSKNSATVSYATKLYPGIWTKIELVLSPMKIDQMENVNIAISLDQITLLRPSGS